VLSTASLVLSIVALSVVWFVVLWLAICYGVAKAAGWGRLRQLYETGLFGGSTTTSAGYVGASRYRGRALIIGASPAGLYLNVSGLFRVGAGPVLIPWRDVTVSVPSSGSLPLVTFEVANARTSLRIPESAANQLLKWQRGVT
jgi:hypothetical protein